MGAPAMTLRTATPATVPRDTQAPTARYDSLLYLAVLVTLLFITTRIIKEHAFHSSSDWKEILQFCFYFL